MDNESFNKIEEITETQPTVVLDNEAFVQQETIPLEKPKKKPLSERQKASLEKARKVKAEKQRQRREEKKKQMKLYEQMSETQLLKQKLEEMEKRFSLLSNQPNNNKEPEDDDMSFFKAEPKKKQKKPQQRPVYITDSEDEDEGVEEHKMHELPELYQQPTLQRQNAYVNQQQSPFQRHNFGGFS